MTEDVCDVHEFVDESWGHEEDVEKYDNGKLERDFEYL
jgi:hypothetical protein